jgi:hypothetical protein
MLDEVLDFLPIKGLQFLFRITLSKEYTVEIFNKVTIMSSFSGVSL